MAGPACNVEEFPPNPQEQHDRESISIVHSGGRSAHGAFIGTFI